jgi:hypothetical protein
VMGGRTQVRQERRRSESADWIREVSDDRLKAYQRVLASNVTRNIRADGAPRSAGSQSYFSGLLSDELSRRGK